MLYYIIHQLRSVPVLGCFFVYNEIVSNCEVLFTPSRACINYNCIGFCISFMKVKLPYFYCFRVDVDMYIEVLITAVLSLCHASFSGIFC